MDKYMLELEVGFCTTFRAKCVKITVRESIMEYLLAMDVLDSSRGEIVFQLFGLTQFDVLKSSVLLH
jgi:hypothetical protein